MKALVTGAGGFAGRHLIAELDGRGYETFGWARRSTSAASLPPDRLILGDLTDAPLVRSVVDDLRPDVIFHLAAQASVAESWRDPASTLMSNLLCQLHLIHAALDLDPRPRLVVCGSNEEYGIVRPDELPIREENPLRPANPYAVSKVAQDLLAQQYFFSHALHIVRIRPFNHFGPGQSSIYVIASFARQVAEIEAGLAEPVLRTGDPAARRDFTDVRDIVRGYADLAEGGAPGEVYNLGSGRDRSIAELIEVFRSFSRCPFEHRVDRDLLRPIDVPVSVCDAGKARRAVGWEPQIPFEESIGAVLDEWRTRVAESSRV